MVLTTSARGRSGRRRANRTPVRRPGSTASPRSARRCGFLSSRSAASTHRTPATASTPAHVVSLSFAPAPMRERCAQRSMPRLAEVGELGLLAELERRGLVRSIENDVAGVAGAGGALDALAGNVRFRLDWIPWRDLGFRAAAVNLSDLAAAGATPDALMVSLGAPAETRLEDVVELYEGLAEPGVPVVGGDTTRAGALVVSVTALGRSERVPGRAGARPGDLLVAPRPPRPP